MVRGPRVVGWPGARWCGWARALTRVVVPLFARPHDIVHERGAVGKAHLVLVRIGRRANSDSGAADALAPDEMVDGRVGERDAGRVAGDALHALHAVEIAPTTPNGNKRTTFTLTRTNGVIFFRTSSVENGNTQEISHSWQTPFENCEIVREKILHEHDILTGLR